MKISTKSIYLILILGTALIIHPRVSFAADLQNATTQVEASHEQLLEVKDDTALSPEEKLQKEIDARVSIVENALSLSLQEISNLKESLTKLPQFTALSRESILSNGFSTDLATFEGYYLSKQSEVSKTTFTLNSIKDFARVIIDYRDTVYNPRTAEIVDFTLLFYNEDAIATAKIRFSKIGANIKTLEKLNIIQVGYFQNGIAQASLLLSESEALDLKAKDMILGNPVLETPPILQPEPSEEAIFTQIVPPPTAQELLIKSLGNIKSAYEIFVQIGKETKSILGIR